MTDYSKYKDYTENDFINDPYFQDWVIRPTDQNNQFWNSFFQTYPEKKEEGESAGIFLKKFIFKEDLPDDLMVKRSLDNHLLAIRQLESEPVKEIRKPALVRRMLKVAAVAGGIILLLSVLLIINRRDPEMLVSTGYGDIRQVVLPDSSVVTLNANSSIKYGKHWNKNENREVWLQGEAFFNIKHFNQDTNRIQPGERFLVHTGEMTIEVLGTSFDIRSRRGKTEVVLETGKIKVSFNDKLMADITMQPGDILNYDSTGKKLIAGKINAEKFSTWKDKKLQLDNPTAAQIIQYLEDNFGKHIVLEDDGLAKREIEGSILLTNLDDALFILSTVLNTEVIKEDSVIRLRPR